MSNQNPTGQQNWGPFSPGSTTAKKPRPPLELGPMSGDGDYIRDRAQNLVSTFSSLLDKDLKLENHPFGCTDCKAYIRAPLSDPEGYLVVEHELSHNLFGTNLPLTEAFREKAVERLLRRAGIPKAHKDAEPYKHKLDMIVHHLWNVLEDHRCRWLWAQLYPGGGELLKQRWHDIAEYEMEEGAEQDLLTYLSRHATGVDTPNAPDKFKACGGHMRRSKNLVEGVDAESCLAITARLVDDIADELLDKYPPDKQQEAKSKLMALSKAVAGGGGKSQQKSQGGQQQPQGGQPGETDEKSARGNPESTPMGGRDLQHPAGRKQRPTAGQMKRIQQVLTAKIDDENEQADGLSSFSALLNDGAEKMEQKLEDARIAMAMPKKSIEEQHEDILTSACKTAKIPGVFVTPTIPLPAPSHAAARIRTHLEKVKMKKKSRLHEEGDDIDIESFLDAKLNNELAEGEFFRKEKKESGMELLLEVDVSGSMLGYGLNMVERAIADVVFACKSMKVEVNLWTFSDQVFFYKKLGSPKKAIGQVHGCTSMVQALDVAYEWAKVSRSTRAVILMTDGMPTSLRGRRSSGDTIQDLHDVLHEMRLDNIILSVLAIGNEGMKDMYDRGFGVGNYGLLPNLDALTKALPQTAKVLVEAHLKRSMR